LKNRPLAVQIWIIFAGISIGISILLIILIPGALRNFFTREIYATIEDAQLARLNNEWASGLEAIPRVEREQKLQNYRAVNHVLLPDRGRTKHENRLPKSFLNKVRSEASQQEKTVEHYSKRIQNQTIFYVIRKENIRGQSIYIVSYMWDSYRNELVRTLFNRIVLILVLVLVISWIPCIWLAKYLSRPLVRMADHVKNIAERDWHEPIRLERKDEIGRLGQSIERMRQRLVRQDEAQQSLLQHISHELKTPVMVIRSYAQSIRDGIYPKGDLSETVKVIEDESERLEKRIQDLLYLTKLDYLSTREPVRETFDLGELIETVMDRLRWHRPDLDWQLDLVPLEIQGDCEQWAVALENLLDNQMRYASKWISISFDPDPSHRESSVVNVRIWNDGPPIEPSLIDSLFHPFHKGNKGKFGLGLAIVQRIAALHQAKVWASNEEDGAAFYIQIPIKVLT
jgi:two-component system sensor histidine kinase CssS